MQVSMSVFLPQDEFVQTSPIDEEKSVDKVYLSAGMTDESVALVYCKCKGTLSTAYMEADEDIEPMLISKEEAKAILASGHKTDIKAYMILRQYCE